MFETRRKLPDYSPGFLYFLSKEFFFRCSNNEQLFYYYVFFSYFLFCLFYAITRHTAIDCYRSVCYRRHVRLRGEGTKEIFLQIVIKSDEILIEAKIGRRGRFIF